MTSLPQQIADHYKGRSGADRLLGIKLLEIDDGYARTRMTITDKMTNIHDTLHGGISFSLAGSAFAYACNAQGYVSVASACSIDYLAPAFVGDVLTATAQRRGQRGKQGIYDVDITNQDDKLIATFRGKSHTTKQKILGNATDE